MQLPIFTIGYSTLPIERFIDILKSYDVQKLIDVRSIPRSRHCPDYNEDVLCQFLKEAKIRYCHMKQLGGLRHASKNSVNTGWINASFRGFADYMQTKEFEVGLEKLKKMVEKKICVIMCAEGVFWRCHRSLIADALQLDGYNVFHIQSKKTAKAHVLTSFLHLIDGKMVYN